MNHSWRKPSPNENSEESEELLPSTVPSGGVRSKSNLSVRRLLCSCLGYAVVAVLSFVFGLILDVEYVRNERASSEPLFLKEVDRSTHSNHTSVPVFGGSNGTIWQQSPSPEVDAAWHALTTGYPFLITEDDMRNLGKDPDRYISVPESFRYGEKKFITRFTHTHNIHCLDHIRKRLYRDYYGYPNDTMDWIHTKHCLHALVDHLTCHVEYDVFNYIWVEGEPTADPDLTYNLQCRDLSALIRWIEANRVDKDLRVFYIQPPAGYHMVPPDAEFRNLEKEFDKSNSDRPSMKERAKTYRKAYEDAISYWQVTGGVPIEEREW